jgi:hypothetical protein
VWMTAWLLMLRMPQMPRWHRLLQLIDDSVDHDSLNEP